MGCRHLYGLTNLLTLPNCKGVSLARKSPKGPLLEVQYSCFSRLSMACAPGGEKAVWEGLLQGVRRGGDPYRDLNRMSFEDATVLETQLMREVLVANSKRLDEGYKQSWRIQSAHGVSL
ncbi:hypothetical protein WJX73_004535 [Symbiochloris irregularis]|uniref:Uncharacterized protein n=1 Tax=Symbiochloris irregularis TaxID=706552 RepID=A0AAW1PSA1_9CHLO